MPIICKERPRQSGTVQYNRPTTERDYIVSGTTERTEALLAVAREAPREDLTVDDQDADVPVFRSNISIKEVGGGVWEATVSYGGTPDSIDLSVSFGVRTVKRYQALETVKSYDCIAGGVAVAGAGAHGNVPDFKGAIGVKGDGDIEGVDIEVGSIEFSITKKWKRNRVSQDYFIKLFRFADQGAVNKYRFTIVWLEQHLIFPKGDLRFRSVNVKSSDTEELEMTYNFAYQSPLLENSNTPFKVGNSANIGMEGWEYGWVHYKTSTSASRITKVPVAFIVNRVYPYEDFEELELGITVPDEPEIPDDEEDE